MDVDWILEVEEERESWMTLVKEYVVKETLSIEKNERRAPT